MTEQKKSTEERLRETVSKETTAFLAASFGGNPFYSHDLTASEAFLCRELDELRAMASKALGQIGMLGLPEPPADGVHVHRKVFSRATYGGESAWICSECLEQGCDYPPESNVPTYAELLAKKRERSGG